MLLAKSRRNPAASSRSAAANVPARHSQRAARWLLDFASSIRSDTAGESNLDTRCSALSSAFGGTSCMPGDFASSIRSEQEPNWAMMVRPGSVMIPMMASGRSHRPTGLAARARQASLRSAPPLRSQARSVAATVAVTRSPARWMGPGDNRQAIVRVPLETALDNHPTRKPGYAPLVGAPRAARSRCRRYRSLHLTTSRSVMPLLGQAQEADPLLQHSQRRRHRWLTGVVRPRVQSQ